MGVDDEISEVVNELLEACEEMRTLAMERRKAEVKGLRVSDTARVDVV